MIPFIDGWSGTQVFTASSPHLGDTLSSLAETDGAGLYAVLDTARNHHFLARLAKSSIEFESLFSRRELAALYHVSPFLVPCRDDTSLVSWLATEAVKADAVIFMISRAPRDRVFDHLQGLLKAITEDDRDVLFRFYDPRVLRTYLPSCNQEEAMRFLGPLSHIIFQSVADDSALVFHRDALACSELDERYQKQPIFIGAEQMQHFRRSLVHRFKGNLKNHLSGNFSREIDALDLDSAGLDQLIGDGMDRARMYGIRRECDVRRYIEYMLLLHTDFDLNPTCQWAGEILFTEGISGKEKMARLDRAVILRMLDTGSDSTDTCS